MDTHYTVHTTHSATIITYFSCKSRNNDGSWEQWHTFSRTNIEAIESTSVHTINASHHITIHNTDWGHYFIRMCFVLYRNFTMSFPFPCTINYVHCSCTTRYCEYWICSRIVMELCLNPMRINSKSDNMRSTYIRRSSSVIWIIWRMLTAHVAYGIHRFTQMTMRHTYDLYAHLFIQMTLVQTF